MKEDLIKIINISIFAPSGDNSQPWKFRIKDNIIYVYNVPEKDSSLYNFNQFASMVAIGALLENIRISATHFGYTSKIILKENFSDNLIAECNLVKTNIDEDDLFKYIGNRKTNRKPYKNNKLNIDALNELQSCEPITGIKLKILNDIDSIKKIANSCSLNEQIVLENKKLHNFLFNHITWTEKEDKVKKGFFIKTLELKVPQNFIFKLLKTWKLNLILNKIGISKLVAKDNAKLYSKSGSILAITSNKLDKISFLNTGIFSQRIWLITTKHNIYMQPLVGVIFLNHLLNNDNSEIFQDKHIKLIKQSYQDIKNLINDDNQFITFMFRAGYTDKPSATTKRHNPEIKL